LITRVYDGLLKLEVDVKEAWHKSNPFLTRPENVVSQVVQSGRTNPSDAVLAQETGVHQETFASLAQAAIAGAALGRDVDPAISQGQAGPATPDGQVAHASQGGQAVQAPPPDSYNLLGIVSLEVGGRLIDWEKGFERKLRSMFEGFELGFTNSGDVYLLGESSYDEDDGYQCDF
jgi:hypothetical protein